MRKKKKAQEFVPDEKYLKNLNIAYDTCTQMDIPVTIENNVLMTRSTCIEDYERFRAICRKIKGVPISYGTVFVGTKGADNV
jgi:hypothetical protein